MTTFEVKDMSCGHCVKAITEAVQTLDAGARIQIDLTNHRVSIDGARADAMQLRDAIRQAGYAPVAVEAPASAPSVSASAAAPSSGCCCG